MNKILFILLGFVYSNLTFAGTASSTIKDGILNGVKTENNIVQFSEEGKGALTDVFIYIKDSIFSLLALIVIGVFLFIGYKIIISRGNPEEFKKAFMMLIYAIIGLLVVSLAWVIVMFVVGLNV